MIKIILATSLFILNTAGIANAGGSSALSIEISRVAQLVSVMQHYQSLHGDEFPNSLGDLRNLVNLPGLLDVNPQLGSFGERHCFVSGDFSIPGFGQIVTMGANPNYDFYQPEKGRVVGYININGVAAAYWLPESEIQKYLASNPDVQILPPMGPIPAPTINLRRESPPTEHQLRVLEHYGVKLKSTPEEKPAPPPAVPPPAPEPIPEPPAPVTLPPAKSSNPLWWITGVIGILAAATFALWRKKPKA